MKLQMLQSKWGVLTPLKPKHWDDLVTCPYGQIHGLPSTHGRLVCVQQDGPLCIIDRGEEWPIVGHFEFFVPDKGQPEPVRFNLKETPAKRHGKKAAVKLPQWLEDLDEDAD